MPGFDQGAGLAGLRPFAPHGLHAGQQAQRRRRGFRIHGWILEDGQLFRRFRPLGQVEPGLGARPGEFGRQRRGADLAAVTIQNRQGFRRFLLRQKYPRQPQRPLGLAAAVGRARDQLLQPSARLRVQAVFVGRAPGFQQAPGFFDRQLRGRNRFFLCRLLRETGNGQRQPSDDPKPSHAFFDRFAFAFVFFGAVAASSGRR